MKKDSKVPEYKNHHVTSIKKLKLSNSSSKKLKITEEKTKIKANKKKLVPEFNQSKNLNKKNISYETENRKSDQVENSIKEIEHSSNELVLCNTSKDSVKETLTKNATNIKAVDVTNDSESEYVPSDEQIESGKYCH